MMWGCMFSLFRVSAFSSSACNSALQSVAVICFRSQSRINSYRLQMTPRPCKSSCCIRFHSMTNPTVEFMWVTESASKFFVLQNAAPNCTHALGQQRWCPKLPVGSEYVLQRQLSPNVLCKFSTVTQIYQQTFTGHSIKRQAIAPLYADADLSRGGTIYYR